MRFFSQLRCFFKPSSASTAEKSSARPTLTVLERSTADGTEYFRERYAGDAPTPHWISFGKKVDPVRAWPDSMSAKLNEIDSSTGATCATGENYLSKLVRLGRRKGSLLMRVSIISPTERAYILGEKLTEIRVRSLN
jgi:hypothetical protein